MDACPPCLGWPSRGRCRPWRITPYSLAVPTTDTTVSCAREVARHRLAREGSMEPMQRLAFGVPTRQAWSLFEEFKHFAFKSNVIDLAVGMIIGATFGKIVDSLVKHILMPLLSVLLPGQQGYLAWKAVIHGKEIPYGLFLGEVVNFLL